MTYWIAHSSSPVSSTSVPPFVAFGHPYHLPLWGVSTIIAMLVLLYLLVIAAPLLLPFYLARRIFRGSSVGPENKALRIYSYLLVLSAFLAMWMPDGTKIDFDAAVSAAFSTARFMFIPLGIYWCSMNTWKWVWLWRVVALLGWVLCAMWLVAVLLFLGHNPPKGMMVLYALAILWLLPAVVILTRSSLRRPPGTAMIAPPNKSTQTLKRIVVGGLFVFLFGFMIFIIVPKAFYLIYLHNEGETIGGLRAIRSALTIYKEDRHGQYPSDLAALTEGGKYLVRIPVAKASSHHQDSSAVLLGSNPNDEGGWLYDNVKGNANFGSVWVNCTHTDSSQNTWNSY